MIIPTQDTYAFLLAGVFVLGAAGGGLSNLTSGGAGAVTIYLLTKFLGLQIQESTGTVLAASAVIVFLGAISFYKKKQVESRLALTVGLSGLAGAFLSAVWVSSLSLADSAMLERAFGAFTLALTTYFAYSLLSSRRSQSKSAFEDLSGSTVGLRGGVSSTQGLRLAAPSLGWTAREGNRWAGSDPTATGVQIAKGLMIGVATGLFGMGLASLSVIAFMVLFGMNTKVALGTGLLASVFRYSGGAVGYVISNRVDPLLFTVLVAGGAIGSVLGSRFILRDIEVKKGDSWIKILQVGLLVFVGCSFLLG